MIENIIVTKIVSVNSIQYRSYINHSKTNRPCCALFFKIGGETIYNHNEKNYTTNRHNCIFLPKGIDYSFSIKELGLCYSIEFEVLNSNEYTVPQTFYIHHPESIAQHVEQLISYWNFPDCPNAKRMSKLYQIISEILKPLIIDYSSKNKKTIIIDSVEYMNTYYQNPNITNKELAKVSKISEVYFRKIFTSVYGISPIKYIINLRIKKAQELLSSDYSTIEDVALSSGFTNIHHFIKTFKSATGFTPTEYSKMRRKTTDEPLQIVTK